MDVGKRIQFFRLKQGITVNKLANIAGVSQSYLREIELGTKQPTVEYLSYICDGLGISLATFFESDESQDDLVSRIQRLSPAKRSAILGLLYAFDE